MPSKESRFFGSSVVPFRLAFIMWLAFSIEFYYGLDLGYLGIKPRTWEGLIGIFTAPMIHGSYMHLLSNTFPLLFLGTILYFFYEPIGNIVFYRSYFITNLLVWLLSPRLSYHVGASGLIYGGIFVAGVLPADPRISWESHLAGALVGAVTAFNLSNKRSG